MFEFVLLLVLLALQATGHKRLSVFVVFVDGQAMVVSLLTNVSIPVLTRFFFLIHR